MQGPSFAVRWATVLLGKASEGGPGAAYYAVAPDPPGPSRRVFIASLLCFAIVAGVLCGIVPHFARVYDSVDVPMPDSTRAVVAVSRAFPWMLPIYALIAGAASWRLRRMRHADVIIVVGMMLVGGFIVLALFQPLLSMGCSLRIGR